MGKDSDIEWTDHTVSFWQGCHKVSPGCLNCYMYRDKKRYGQDPTKVIRSAARTFFSPLKWKEPAMVFVCSWSDFFHEDADEWRDEAWEIMRRTPHLTYQILTKRPENIEGRIPDDWPLPNVWLGVTAENQEMADQRIPLLLSIPAAIHFVSVEPMIGPVNLEGIEDLCHSALEIDWVICGAESGPNSRPMDRDWVRALRDQCAKYRVAFMFKQGLENGKLVKKPFLDGRQHLEMPR